MTFSRKATQFVTDSLSRFLPSFGLLAGIVLLPMSAFAASPWVQAISNLANDFTGPIAKGLSLVAIVWGGVMLAFTEGGDSKRLTPELLLQLETAVELLKNILISGGTGTGKTTLLNALSQFIGSEERVIVIEDTSEIQIEKDNMVRLEARREQPGLPSVSIRELLKATLRLRPDRIIVGEIRGGEAFDFLQALNTGHSGSMSTIHANSAPEALSRLGTCVLMSGIDLPYKVIRQQIAESLDIALRRNGRGLQSIEEHTVVKTRECASLLTDPTREARK
jgi:Flp pilus assembly CpaF family ATPase/type IV secretory pathway VirB2 component (pilin)